MPRKKLGISYSGKLFTIILIFVLLGITASSLVAFNVFTHYAENQIGEASIAGIRDVSKIMAVLTDSMKRDAVHLTMLLNESGVDGMDATSISAADLDSILLRKNLYNSLVSLNRANTYFSSIYLYMQNLDYMISSDGEFAVSSRFSDLKWLADYQAYGANGDYWLGARTVYLPLQESYRRVLTYVHPFSSYISPAIKGFVVFNISEAELAAAFSDTAESQTAIINRAGEIMCRSADTNPAEIVAAFDIVEKNSTLLNEHGLIAEIDGKSSFISSAAIDIGDNWLLVRTSEMASLYSVVAQNTRLLLTSILLLSCISIVLVWICARRLSMPITQLKNQLDSDTRFQSAEPDDIRRIKRALDYLQHEEKRLSNEIEKRNHVRSQRYAADLFLAETMLNTADRDEALDQLLNSRTCITLYFSDDSNVSKLKDINREECAQYQGLITQMCMDAIGAESSQCIVLQMKTNMLIVFHAYAAWQSRGAEFRQILQALLDNVQKTLGFSLTIGISNPWQGVGNARGSFVEARAAARMKLLLGYRYVIAFEQVPKSKNQLFYPAQYEKQLFAAITARDNAQAQSAIHSIIEVLRKNGAFTIDEVLLILNQFIGALVRFLTEESVRCGIALAEPSQILDMLYYKSFETLNEVSMYLTMQVYSVINQLSESGALADTAVKRIKAYINECYMNDVSIESITNHIGIGYSYARKVFKEETAHSILDYLQERRIEKAKELLRDTSMNIRDIAQAVGFNQEQSFCRCFKKMENMLPSKYRSVNQG